MNKAVMQQALDALEQLDGLDTDTECVTIYVSKEIEALRAELAKPEPDDVVRLKSAIETVKRHVTGESSPNWSGGEATYRSRLYLADVCDAALTPIYRKEDV